MVLCFLDLTDPRKNQAIPNRSDEFCSTDPQPDTDNELYLVDDVKRRRVQNLDDRKTG